MIFYGTGNYFKRNHQYHRAACDGCGKPGFLQNYDATRFFHLYWIPLIPLGSKHIIDQCPACKVGREMSLSEWHKARNTRLPPAIQALKANPTDRDLAEKALALATSVGTKEEFLKVMGTMGKHHSNDPDLMAKMAWSLSYFNMPAESQQVLEAALRLKDDEELREFQRYQQSQPQIPTPKAPSRIPSLIPVLLVPLVLLVIVIMVAVAGLSGKPKHIYAANGLESSYEILVNGETHRIEPNHPSRIPAVFGQNRVESAPGAPPFEPIDLQVEGGFFDKVGGGPTIVINPDQLAVIIWEKAVYTENPDLLGPNEGDIRVYTGRQKHEFKDLNLRFEEFPEEVQISSGNTRAYRTGIYQLESDSPASSIYMLLSNDYKDEAAALAAAAFPRYPDDLYLLSLTTSLLPPEKSLEILRGLLDEMPVHVQVHRQYQDLMESSQPGHDLEAEYRKRLDAAPGNADLAYLLGRVLDDPAEATALWTRALESSPRAAWPAYALGYQEMNEGRFAEARAHVAIAIQGEPDNYAFQAADIEMLLATGDYAAFAERQHAALEEDPLNETAALNLVLALSVLGDDDGSSRVADQYLQAAKEEYELEDTVLSYIRAMFEASAARGKKDREAFVEAARRANDTHYALQAALVSGDFAAVEAALKELKETEMILAAEESLTVYAALKAAGRTDLADSILTDTLASMKESGRSGAEKLIAWFEAGTPPTLEEFSDFPVYPSGRRQIAVALAWHYPQARDEFLALADKMNFDPRFPHFVIDQLVRRQPE